MERNPTDRNVAAGPGEKRQWEPPRLKQLGVAGAAGSVAKDYDTVELTERITPPYAYWGPS